MGRSEVSGTVFRYPWRRLQKKNSHPIAPIMNSGFPPANWVALLLVAASAILAQEADSRERKNALSSPAVTP
jgi:hypothetical protein